MRTFAQRRKAIKLIRSTSFFTVFLFLRAVWGGGGWEWRAVILAKVKTHMATVILSLAMRHGFVAILCIIFCVFCC